MDRTVALIEILVHGHEAAVGALLASGGNRQNKFIENLQNWIIEKDQTTQFWLIS